MIYFFDDLEGLSNEFIIRALKLLPKDRREKALRYRCLNDRKRCIVAYLLLIFGIFYEFGILINPQFDYLENGKPILSEYPYIHFNLSHCKKGIICIIDKVQVGIDIEEIAPFSYDVASIVCNSCELKKLHDSSNQDMCFCEMWSAKESVVKQNGVGISKDIKKINTEHVSQAIFKSMILSVSK